MHAYKSKVGGYRADFGSLDELCGWIEATPSACKFNYSGSGNGSPQGSAGWHGTGSWAEAQKLVREGWPAGRSKLKSAVSKIPPIQQARARILSQGRDVGGAHPDVPLAVAGEPACMVTIGEQERATRPFIRFRINCAASAAIDVETIQARGAVLLAYVDELEQAGARCEIVMECGLGHGTTDRIDVSVMVKRADEHLDIDRLSYVLINPSFLRRHCFAHAERAPGCPFNKYDGLYGPPHDLEEDANDGIASVHFGSQMWGATQWTSPEKAAAFVREEILKACGDLSGMLAGD